MQTVWSLRETSAFPDSEELVSEISGALKVSPLTAGLLVKRGLASVRDARIFLSPALEDLLDPFLLPGIREAAELVRRHVSASSRILIHGDYDADGVTSSAILFRALKKMGVEPFVFLPHRVSDGYGFTRAGVNSIKENKAELLITVDCGISAANLIGEVKAMGIDVIVVDHHQVPSHGLPQASVIVHSSLSESGNAFKDLSAVGLTFKLTQALLGSAAYEFLDLVAAGTVADMAPLTGENRILVKYGLKRMAEGGTLGLKAIAGAARIRGKMSAGQLAFIFGPRINASGRMDTAEHAFRLLISEDEREAGRLAQILEEENRRRQKIERQVCAEAIEKAERETNFKRDRVIVVWGKDWHQGVSGIVASRLVERFYRPSIVISFDGEGAGKGSARSIRRFNIFAALEKSAEFLEEFGGHEQAAGLKIEEGKLVAFRSAINEAAQSLMGPSCLVKSFDVDFEVGSLGDLSLPFLRELDLLEPFGLGNPKPLFLSKNLKVKRPPVFSGRDRLQLWVEDSAVTLEANWYRPRQLPRELANGIDLVYTPALRNIYGQETPSLEVKDLKLSQ